MPIYFGLASRLPQMLIFAKSYKRYISNETGGILCIFWQMCRHRKFRATVCEVAQFSATFPGNGGAYHAFAIAGN
jgi:hypothetical protein